MANSPRKREILIEFKVEDSELKKIFDELDKLERKSKELVKTYNKVNDEFKNTLKAIDELTSKIVNFNLVLQSTDNIKHIEKLQREIKKLEDQIEALQIRTRRGLFDTSALGRAGGSIEQLNRRLGLTGGIFDRLQRSSTNYATNLQRNTRQSISEIEELQSRLNTLEQQGDININVNTNNNDNTPVGNTPGGEAPDGSRRRRRRRPEETVDDVLGGIFNLSNLLGNLPQLIAAAFAVDQIKEFAFESFKIAAGVETQITKIKILVGNLDKAKAIYSNLKNVSNDLGLSTDTLADAYIKLANRGIKPTNDELTNIADIASSQGKEIDQFIEAILDAQTGEFERLKEFGIRAEKANGNVTLSWKGVTKVVKENETAVFNALVAFGDLQGVQGSLVEQQNTLAGSVNRMKIAYEQFQLVVGNLISTPVSSFFKELTDQLTRLTNPKLRDDRTLQERINADINSFDELAGKIKIVNDLTFVAIDADDKYTQASKNLANVELQKYFDEAKIPINTLTASTLQLAAATNQYTASTKVLRESKIYESVLNESKKSLKELTEISDKAFVDIAIKIQQPLKTGILGLFDTNRVIKNEIEPFIDKLREVGVTTDQMVSTLQNYGLVYGRDFTVSLNGGIVLVTSALQNNKEAVRGLGLAFTQLKNGAILDIEAMSNSFYSLGKVADNFFNNQLSREIGVRPFKGLELSTQLVQKRLKEISTYPIEVQKNIIELEKQSFAVVDRSLFAPGSDSSKALELLENKLLEIEKIEKERGDKLKANGENYKKQQSEAEKLKKEQEKIIEDRVKALKDENENLAKLEESYVLRLRYESELTELQKKTGNDLIDLDNQRLSILLEQGEAIRTVENVFSGERVKIQQNDSLTSNQKTTLISELNSTFTKALELTYVKYSNKLIDVVEKGYAEIVLKSEKQLVLISDNIDKEIVKKLDKLKKDIIDDPITKFGDIGIEITPTFDLSKLDLEGLTNLINSPVENRKVFSFSDDLQEEYGRFFRTNEEILSLLAVTGDKTKSFLSDFEKSLDPANKTLFNQLETLEKQFILISYAAAQLSDRSGKIDFKKKIQDQFGIELPENFELKAETLVKDLKRIFSNVVTQSIKDPDTVKKFNQLINSLTQAPFDSINENNIKQLLSLFSKESLKLPSLFENEGEVIDKAKLLSEQIKDKLEKLNDIDLFNLTFIEEKIQADKLKEKVDNLNEAYTKLNANLFYLNTDDIKSGFGDILNFSSLVLKQLENSGVKINQTGEEAAKKATLSVLLAGNNIKESTKNIKDTLEVSTKLTKAANEKFKDLFDDSGKAVPNFTEILTEQFGISDGASNKAKQKVTTFLNNATDAINGYNIDEKINIKQKLEDIFTQFMTVDSGFIGTIDTKDNKVTYMGEKFDSIADYLKRFNILVDLESDDMNANIDRLNTIETVLSDLSKSPLFTEIIGDKTLIEKQKIVLVILKELLAGREAVVKEIKKQSDELTKTLYISLREQEQYIRGLEKLNYSKTFEKIGDFAGTLNNELFRPIENASRKVSELFKKIQTDLDDLSKKTPDLIEKLNKNLSGVSKKEKIITESVAIGLETIGDVFAVINLKQQENSDVILKLIDKEITAQKTLTEESRNRVTALTNELEQLRENEQQKYIAELENLNQLEVLRRNAEIEEIQLIDEKYNRITSLEEAYRTARLRNSEELLLAEKNRLASQEAAELQLERKKEEQRKKAFENSKKLQIAQTVMNTAAAVIKAYVDLPYPLSIAASAVIAGLGAAQIGVIASQKYSPLELNEGTDYVNHPQGKIGVDTIPATLSKGEAIIPYRQNMKYRNLVRDIINDDMSQNVIKSFNEKEISKVNHIKNNKENNIISTKEIADMIQKLNSDRTSVNIDSNGFSVFLEKNRTKQSYRNNKYNFKK